MLRNAFDDLPRTPAEHFKLCFYAAVLRLIDKTAELCGSYKNALEKHPFLVGYHNELASHGLEGRTTEDAPRWWKDALIAWEKSCANALPLRALAHACKIDYEGIIMILCAGLVEEDGRFGQLFESALGPAAQRPTIGILQDWFGAHGASMESRSLVRRLLEAKILEPVNPDAPWVQRMLHIHPSLWRLLQGEQTAVIEEGIRYRPIETAERLDQLILPVELLRQSAQCRQLLQAQKLKLLIIRGTAGNGRRTLAGAIARSMDRAIVEFDLSAKPDNARSGLYAITLNAIPLIKVDANPGETAEFDPPGSYEGPIFAVTGKQGGIRSDRYGLSATLRLDIPSPELRKRHWLSVTGNGSVPALLNTMRIGGGRVRELAKAALVYSGIEKRTEVRDADIRAAKAAWSAHALESLAVPLKPLGTWDDVAAEKSTMEELRLLEDRCRYREAMVEAAGRALQSQMTFGVRALFTGPSGTGKTLSARILASMLGMELYRVDLSAIVNKYIGETEKNLNRVFTLSEEHDVVLLIDEGDALLTSRTAVQTSNDRYANLETNFLLQRLENYEGICVITTNAPERVDAAFMRRMDVIVNFRIPDSGERRSIWKIHLDPASEISDEFIAEIASRCAVTGGQIRNATLHASLLALRENSSMKAMHVESAIRREYRKTGAICPLR
jgi:hypothetical protein